MSKQNRLPADGSLCDVAGVVRVIHAVRCRSVFPANGRHDCCRVRYKCQQKVIGWQAIQKRRIVASHFSDMACERPERSGGDLPFIPVLRSSARGCCMVATVVSTQGQACAIVSRPLNHRIMASQTLLSVQLIDAPNSRGTPRGAASTLLTSQRDCARRLS